MGSLKQKSLGIPISDSYEFQNRRPVLKDLFCSSFPSFCVFTPSLEMISKGH
uniref:Uncharacterized protein n=1 Tax=Meloidogyne enterolobii TaxID=390850 RepID=A0A6V7TUQ3_MELEN|nr:unnamed protein product [Meloidogyne enterolobii]